MFDDTSSLFMLKSFARWSVSEVRSSPPLALLQVRLEDPDAVRLEDELAEVAEDPGEGQREVEEAVAADVLHVQEETEHAEHVQHEHHGVLAQETLRQRVVRQVVRAEALGHHRLLGC